MATITTAKTPAPLVRTFNRAPGSPIEPFQVFRWNSNEVTTGTGVGDTEDLYCELSLPSGYGYRVLNFAVTFYDLSLTERNAWDTNGFIEIQNPPQKTKYQPTQVVNGHYQTGDLLYSTHSPGMGASGGDFPNVLSGILDAVATNPNLDPKLVWRCVNTTASIGAVPFNISCDVIQYNSEQMEYASAWGIGALLNS